MATQSSPEFLAISKNIDGLCRGIVRISSVSNFALKLEEKGFIGDGAKDVLSSPVSDYDKCSRLLDAVKEQVRQNGNKFESFVKIFSSEAALSTYSDVMLAAYNKEKGNYKTSPEARNPPNDVPLLEAGELYASMMTNLVSILNNYPGSLDRMVTFFTHFAECTEIQDYLNISRRGEEFKSVQLFFKCLAPHLKPPDCSLLERLVSASECEEAKRILDEYLIATRNTSQEKSQDEDSSKISTPPTVSSEPLLGDSNSSHVTTVVATEEMSWGGLRNLQALICGVFEIPRYFLGFERASPGSIILRWKTSKTILKKMSSIYLNTSDLKHLSEAKVISIELDEIIITVNQLEKTVKLQPSAKVLDPAESDRNNNRSEINSVIFPDPTKTAIIKQRSKTCPSLFYHRSSKSAHHQLSGAGVISRQCVWGLDGSASRLSGNFTINTSTTEDQASNNSPSLVPKSEPVPPKVVIRVKTDRNRQRCYHKIKSHGFLDDMGDNNYDFEPLYKPNSTMMLVKTDDEHRPVNRIRRPSRRRISFIRSLESGLDLVGLESDTRSDSWRSLNSLSSEEDLDQERVTEEGKEEEEEDYPVTTQSDTESTGDEVCEGGEHKEDVQLSPGLAVDQLLVLPIEASPDQQGSPAELVGSRFSTSSENVCKTMFSGSWKGTIEVTDTSYGLKLECVKGRFLRYPPAPPSFLYHQNDD